MASADAGVHVVCPGCGATTFQKAMIPVLGEGGAGIAYLCASCARQLVDKAQTARRDNA